MSEQQNNLDELKKKRNKLENREIELKATIEAIEKKNKEKAKAEEKRRVAELDFLKFQAAHLTQFLDSLQENPGSK